MTTNETKPTICDRLHESTVRVRCPYCTKITTATFTALIGSGQVPKTDNLCSFCGKEYVVYADLDLTVRRMGEGF